MKITRIVISRGRTLNTGNYNSARHDVTMEAQVDEDEDWEEVNVRLSRHVRESLETEIEKRG